MIVSSSDRLRFVLWPSGKMKIKVLFQLKNVSGEQNEGNGRNLSSERVK